MESTCESQSKSVYTAEFMGTALKVHVQVSDRMSMNPGEAEHMFFCSRCTRKCLCLSAHFFGSLGSRTGKKGRGGENRRKYVKRGAYLSKAVTGCEDPEGEQSKTKL